MRLAGPSLRRSVAVAALCAVCASPVPAALFGQRFTNWLAFYNAQRPHHALGHISPLHSS